MKKLLVLLAQAHGSNTKGKRSPDGALLEYKWSREICAILARELMKRGIDAQIINPEDTEVHLSTQAGRANAIYRQKKGEYEHIILLSPHVNAAPGTGWSKASGWGAYVYTGASKNSRKLATSLAKIAYEDYGLTGDRWIPKSLYYEQNLAICRQTIMPAVLTENMFQTNHNDVAFLLSEKGKQIIVDIHIRAILDYIS